MGRKKLTQDARKKTLTFRYGDEILSDLKKLATDLNYTLEDVGSKYGFTREYARQLFHNVNGFRYTIFVNSKKDKRRSKKILRSIEKKNPYYKVEHCQNTNSTIGKGSLGEKKVLEICETLNYKVTPYHQDRSIDLVINGYMVDVKSAYKSRFSAQSQVTKAFHFNRRISQRKSDFIICYAVPLNKFFVIPNNDFPQCDHLYIPEKPVMEWTLSKGGKQVRKSKWYRYLEAWYLLERKEEIVFNSSLSASAVAI